MRTHSPTRSVALYGLQRFADAHAVLLEAGKREPGDRTVQAWLNKPEIVAVAAALGAAPNGASGAAPAGASGAAPTASAPAVAKAPVR